MTRGLARLRHPNLALDPPPGFTLAERLAKRPLAPVEARRLARDVCAGLLHAHAQGVVHGRLGPDAVVEDGKHWVVCGLDGAGRDADPRDDVRGVGALLYQALTGTAPVGGAQTLALPRSLRAPILRSLHELPERRYGTLLEMAVALGVAKPPAPVKRRRWPVVPLVGMIGLGVVILARSAGGKGERPAAVPAAVAAPAPAAAPRVVRIADFAAPADAAWLGPGVAAMLATVLGEAPGLEIVREGDGFTIDGTVEHEGKGWVLAARLVEPAGQTTVAAERIAAASLDELVARVGALGEKYVEALAPGTRAPRLASLATGSAAAWEASLAGDLGDEDGWRRAIAADPGFFLPRARLAGWLAARGQAAEARQALDEARPLAPRAGAAGLRLLARLEARTPEERVHALELERAHAPHDLALAAELASADRAAGRIGDCVTEAARAGAHAATDLTLCRLAAGDAAGALAAAAVADDPVLAGDVALALGRFGDAREAYRRAGAKAGARLALVALRAQGKCRAPTAKSTVDDARIAHALALACGDWDEAKAAEDAARKKDPRAADELAMLRAAARGEKRTYARARSRADDAGLWAADGLDRGRRYGPVLAAARGEARADALAGFAPAPSDRFGLFEEPLLFQVALAQADLGSAEDAALACAELPAPLIYYCQGRAAEAAADVAGAFGAYREYLDRMSDADPDFWLTHEAARRIRLVVSRAHERDAQAHHE